MEEGILFVVWVGLGRKLLELNVVAVCQVWSWMNKSTSQL
jgi:hypothetical protein